MSDHLPECPKSGCPACFEQGHRQAISGCRNMAIGFLWDLEDTINEQTKLVHLPECLVPIFGDGLWLCICSQLHACELRVNRRVYELAALFGYNGGYTRG